MIEAKVREGEGGPTRGVYRFLSSPGPGDHIHVGNIRGSMDVLRVLYVEHHPAKVPVNAYARQEPELTICVEEIDSYGD